MPTLKKVVKVVGGVLGVVVVGAAGYAGWQVVAYGKSMDKVYAVPALAITASKDPVVIDRGRHLSESLGGCTASTCHGADLGGATEPIAMGPVATLHGPNLTPAGVVATYTDGELGRLIVHGVKKDGRSVLFMPSMDFNWWPDDDVTALVSYLRSVPPVTRTTPRSSVGLLGKVLDRRGLVHLDVARRIDHAVRPSAPTPAPTAIYGAYVARLCMGCHGEHLSGGRIPGTPSSVPTPTNITPTGLAGWTYEGFDHLLTTGVRPNGTKLDPFMPIDAFSKMAEVEKRAVWAYLESVPGRPTGGR